MFINFLDKNLRFYYFEYHEFQRFWILQILYIFGQKPPFFILLNISSKKWPRFPKTNNNQEMKTDFKTILSDPS